MNYIVFDLEWNQCPYGKDQENERIPFEILEMNHPCLHFSGGNNSNYHRD